MSPVPAPDIKFTKIFINNEWRNSISGKTFATINPANGKKIADVQEGDKADIDEAVKAAQEAFKLDSPWRTMDASARGRLLLKLADLVDEDRDYLARLESLDNGKPYTTALNELSVVASTFRYYGGAADKIHGKTLPTDGDVFSYTRYEPIGVCGAILPWNGPIVMFAWKLGPCLAAGNTIVIKPAEQTPLTALYTTSLVQKAGFPPGVVNVVPGFGPTAGSALTAHMDVDKVGFTGSTPVGKMVQEASSKSNLKHVVLELGGKSPLVVFDDCNLELAATVAHESIFYNQGQVCCAPSRIFVQENIYDDFVKLSKQLALKRTIGDPLDPKTTHGPVVNEMQFNKVLELIESGKKEGAKIECGGKKCGDKGYYIQPTVFSNVQDGMKIAVEEIFGPVQQILKFKTLEEVIARANKTQFGLAAGVFTQDIDKALRYAHSVQAGSVWVNTYNHFSCQNPFGGYKMSGQGREMGMDGMKEFYEIKTVVIKVPKKNS